MGKIEDLKKQVYGDFMEWLDEKKIGDCFSNDVWGVMLFNRLFNVYDQERKAQQIKAECIAQLSDADLEEIHKYRNAMDAEKAKQSDMKLPEGAEECKPQPKKFGHAKQPLSMRETDAEKPK